LATLDPFILAFQSVFASGLVLASLYVLMAAGLALVWNTLGIFNFTHGALMAIAAYVAWTVADPRGLDLGLAVGVIAAIAVAALLGLLINYLLVAPFLGQKQIVLIAVMTTLSGAFFLENSALLIWGPRIKQLDKLVEGNVRIAGTTISGHEAIIIVVAPLLMLGLWAFLKFTWTGSAIRAVAQNRGVCRIERRAGAKNVRHCFCNCRRARWLCRHHAWRDPVHHARPRRRAATQGADRGDPWRTWQYARHSAWRLSGWFR
jgi:branched-subunit amino acid ABC-type transport system permease component